MRNPFTSLNAQPPTLQPYRTLREPITALSLSLTGALLLVGTALGNVHVYDVPSHQLLRTINAHPGPGLAITHLTALLKPPDLVGHVQLGGDKDGGIPVLPIVPFQRMREARPREAHEVTMMLPHARNVCFFLLLNRSRWFSVSLMNERLTTDHARVRHNIHPRGASSRLGIFRQAQTDDFGGTRRTFYATAGWTRDGAGR